MIKHTAILGDLGAGSRRGSGDRRVMAASWGLQAGLPGKAILYALFIRNFTGNCIGGNIYIYIYINIFDALSPVF